MGELPFEKEWPPSVEAARNAFRAFDPTMADVYAEELGGLWKDLSAAGSEGVDVELEAKNIVSWLRKNKKRKLTPAFIRNWLARCPRRPMEVVDDGVVLGSQDAAAQLWARVLPSLQADVTRYIYQFGVLSLEPLALSETEFVLRGKQGSRLAPLIRQQVLRLTGWDGEVRIVRGQT